MTDQELDRMLDAWTAPELPASLRRPWAQKRQWRPWAVAAAVVLVCGAAVGTSVMTREPMVGATWARFADGTHLRVQTVAQPWWAAMRWGTVRGSSSTRGDEHRHCVAGAAADWFACYALQVQAAGEGLYRVAVREWTPGTEELERLRWRGARQAALASAPGVRLVRRNEPFEVELVREPGGERLFDRVTLSSREFEDVPSSRSLGEGPFGAAEMRLSNPRLFVNGKLAAEAQMEARGMTLFFTLPGRGEWRLAVDNGGHPGFVEAGTVEGTVLRFRQGGEEFVLECDQPVVAGSGVRRLYVWRRADVQGDGGAAPFGSAGPASLMPR